MNNKKIKMQPVIKPILCGAALRVAVSFWMPDVVRAKESQLVPEQTTQPVAVEATHVPVTEVEVKDSKEKAKEKEQAKVKPKLQEKEGSAKSGYQIRTVQLGLLGKMSVQDTPFSINVVSSELMKNMQAQSSSDALKYNPTVQSTTGNSLMTDYYVIRGFTSTVWSPYSNTALDGMRCYAPIEPIEDKERIEVLSGSNSFLYGITSPGGMVNYVMKRPTDSSIANVTLGNYGGSQAYVTGDFGGALGQSGKVSYRLNILQTDKGNTGVKHQTNKRSLVSGAIDWHVNPNTLWSFDTSYFHRNLEYAQALFMIGSATKVPDALDGSKNWGAPYSFFNDNVVRYGTNVTSKINDTFTLRAGLRYSDIERESLTYREAWQNNTYKFKQRLDYQDTQTLATQGNLFLDADFVTGSIQHKLTFGWTKDWAEYKYKPSGNVANKLSSIVYNSNLFDANYVVEPRNILDSIAAASKEAYRTTEKTTVQSVLLSDLLTFNKSWSMLVGGNYATIDDKNWNLSTGVLTNEYNKGKLTPSVALMYKPVPTVTVYTSYIEALQKGLYVTDTTAPNYGQSLEPYLSKQIEFGVKSKLGSMDVNAAVFRIEQANQYQNGQTLVYSTDGREVHNGAEVAFSGKVSEHLTLGGGFTFLNANVEKTNTVALLDKTPQGVANKIARLYAEYTLPSMPSLTLIGGVSYTGSEWVDALNTISIPGVTLWDVGARYRTKWNGHDVIWRLKVNNITGKNYWTTRSGILYVGNPRMVTLAVEMKL